MLRRYLARAGRRLPWEHGCEYFTSDVTLNGRRRATTLRLTTLFAPMRRLCKFHAFADAASEPIGQRGGFSSRAIRQPVSRLMPRINLVGTARSADSGICLLFVNSVRDG